MPLFALTCLPPLSQASDTVIRLSEPVYNDSSSEHFGKRINDTLPRVSLAELSVNSDKYLDAPFLMTSRIAKVCQKKGCFFIAQEGKHTIRVAFKDYGFFIPTDSSDKTMTLEGRLIKREMTTAQAEHFNSDLSKPDDNAKPVANFKAGVVYEIVAEGVRIPLEG